MTAQEKEGERVVLVVRGTLAGQLEDRGGLLSVLPGGLASPCVDETARGYGDEPRSRAVRNAFSGPLLCGGEERFLRRVLACVELPVSPYERAEDLRRKLAQQILDGRLCPQKSGGASMTWRTSIGCLTKATIFEAISIARASLSTSTIQ